MKRPPRKETLFPGITRHAKALGCSYVHLHLVLKGERTTRYSAELLRRYKALLKKEGKPTPPALAA